MQRNYEARVQAKVLCDFWYAKELSETALSFEKYAVERCGKFWSNIFLPIPIFRALLLVYLGRNFAAIAPNWYSYGRTICILLGSFRTRKLIILECIDYDIKGKGVVIEFIYRMFAKLVLGPCMARSVLGLQVMTEWEQDLFISRYGLARDQVSAIRWPLAGWGNISRSSGDQHEADQHEAYVFSSGRSACDWNTLFRAAEIGKWPLVVVCSAKDKRLVDKLNVNRIAVVYSEISLEHHNRLLSNAVLCVICLRECTKSSGQYRLGTCIEAGIPVIATQVRGLDQYLVDGVTGKAVELGDPVKLSDAVTTLLSSERERLALVNAATAYTASYTKQDYFAAINRFISNAIEPRSKCAVGPLSNKWSHLS